MHSDAIRDAGNTPCNKVFNFGDVALLGVVLALLLVVADRPLPHIGIIITRIIIQFFRVLVEPVSNDKVAKPHHEARRLSDGHVDGVAAARRRDDAVDATSS